MPKTNSSTSPDNHDFPDRALSTQPPANPVSPTADTSKPIDAIVRINRAQLVDALQYLWIHHGKPSPKQAEHFIKYADQSALPLDLCWANLRSDGNLFPVVLALPNKGRTAMIFASHFTDRKMQPNLIRLLTHITHDLDPDRIRIAQVLLTPLERRAQPTLESAGFFNLAELSYMEAKPSANPLDDSEDHWPENTTIEPYSQQNENDFKTAILASYQNTLDCPGLCELRNIDDVLDGHKGAGLFNPDLWTLVRVNNQPAAVLLLSHFPDQDTLELTYLGVGEQYRGNRLGRLLTRRAIAAAQKCNTDRITLAVDNRNTPAIRLYKHAGFRRIDRRTAMILAVDSARSISTTQ